VVCAPRLQPRIGGSNGRTALFRVLRERPRTHRGDRASLQLRGRLDLDASDTDLCRCRCSHGHPCAILRCAVTEAPTFMPSIDFWHHEHVTTRSFMPPGVSDPVS
jgi:hypothetical protein